MLILALHVFCIMNELLVFGEVGILRANVLGRAETQVEDQRRVRVHHTIYHFIRGRRNIILNESVI